LLTSGSIKLIEMQQTNPDIYTNNNKKNQHWNLKNKNGLQNLNNNLNNDFFFINIKIIET
jgi:hypothetical protein